MQPAEVWAPHPLASLQEPHSRGFSFQGDRWDSERDREMERERLTGKDNCSLNTNYNNNLWQVLESPGAYKVSCGKCGNPLGHEFLKDGPDGVGSRWTFFLQIFQSDPTSLSIFQVLNIQPFFEVCAQEPKVKEVWAEDYFCTNMKLWLETNGATVDASARELISTDCQSIFSNKQTLCIKLFQPSLL